ncbi:ATP-binding cassette domain-containing protein [Streptomyces milbemycinicus]|uniref:ATP-binding cassette domain-containing protein n=1 Tax=Streptomyces milbemycinicus TaxID=476552 RepID=UPI001FE79F91|nr:ATP-binding cassette domain-containing protein [Streptomyces milbemycinicus]
MSSVWRRAIPWARHSAGPCGSAAPPHRRTAAPPHRRTAAPPHRRTAAKEDVPDRVAALLEAVGLPGDFARRYSHQLSGGRRQRTSIPRALAAEPDLLLCDEITSALDPEITDAIMDLLTRLQAEKGLTLVRVANELDLVTACARTTHHIEDGQVRPAVQMPASAAPLEHGCSPAE